MNDSDRPLSLGYSPCPNDTFIFYGLVHNIVQNETTRFAPPFLEDVETLNSWALTHRLDISKISFHAYGHIADDYVLLSAGSALGRGCGPLLVCRPDISGGIADKSIAIPGELTTAAMLMRLYCPEAVNLKIMRFDRIMPAIAAGEVEAGVIIHESRFTYEQYGLSLVQDLGEWWEKTTGHPIPLGGIVARRSLGPATIAAVNHLLRKSVRWAFQNRDLTLPYIKEHAQELDDNIIASHIALYVNNFTVDLGGEGKAAVLEFINRGAAAGLFSAKRECLFAEDL